MALVIPSSSIPRYDYQVFLSFRVEDTRSTFTDHLYNALIQAGFCTFIDDDEVERGKHMNSELGKPIQKSRISIIVFSKNYASSRCCLDELVMFLNYRRGSKHHVVLPVFYDVDPSEVRKQTGSIGEAFARYEEESDDGLMEKIKGWRAALKDVADLAGMVLQNQDDGYEAKFIHKLINVVEEKLNRHTVLYVAPYLVGIDTRVKNINMWLQDRSSNVEILVICGIGGIGKTTIAKYVYNLNIREFERSSFLANVKDSSLPRLQRQILADILRRETRRIYNVDEGSVKIKEAICCKKVLVVLDDVDEVNQLDALLGTREFYPGSKIIITTRKKWLLKAHEVHKVHIVENLDDYESLELFSWHAFGRHHPIEGYLEQSRRVVEYCGGIPLAHKLLGSSLSGMSIDVWKSALKKLESIPEAQILNKLKISYDSLHDDHDKNLFLHIACFFVGKSKDDVVRILDKCDFFTMVGIENLIRRCLVNIDEENKLTMHQSIQEMGRETIHKESPKEPGRRSRLWRHKDSFNVLKEKKGTRKIEGLILDMHIFKEDVEPSLNINNRKKRQYDESLPNRRTSLKRRYLSFFSWQSVGTSLGPLDIDAFERMDKLKLLQLNYVKLNGCYGNFPGKLRWLCWHGFPLKSIPSDLPLGNLVALDMRHSKLEQLWDETKVLGSLKILNLSHSHGLAKTPNFLGLPNLEKLILKGCASLVEVCESIGTLEGLTLLNLKDCKNLSKFPNIGMLKFLETLIISGCLKFRELPMYLRNMESLKVFHADRLTINPVPTATKEVKLWHAFPWPRVSKPRISLWDSLPRSLVTLSLVDCNLFDDSFPVDFGNISMLQNLNLSENPFRILPDCIKSLDKLKKLYLNSCAKLQSVVGLPNVEMLRVGGSTSLKRITWQSSSFYIPFEGSNCNELIEIQGMFKLEPIEQVENELLNSLGFFNVELMRNLRVRLHNYFHPSIKEHHIQGLYEFGIFSTFLPRGGAPSWFNDENTRSSSISFMVPSLPNHKIRGLNVCAVYALSNNKEIWFPRPLFTKIINKTKDLNWIYNPMFFGIPENDEEEVAWLSHWKFGNQLEGGDEVDVSIIVGDGFKVKGCGIKLVWGEEEEEEVTYNDDSYLSWKMGVRGDLSLFEVSAGAYYLCRCIFHTRNHHSPSEDDCTTTSWFQELFGDFPELEDIKDQIRYWH